MPINQSSDRLKQFLKRIGRTPAFMAFLINIVFLILVLFFCDLKYEVSDDFEMAAILSGAYGETQNPHLIFVNILIGYVLIPFYKLFPQISWYFVFQITVIFLSSTTVTFLLLRRLNLLKATAITFLMLAFFTSDAYILVQFTKTAMFATFSGSILFIDELFKEQKKRILFFSAGLCICGTLFRFSTIYICGGFLILILLYEFTIFIRSRDYKEILQVVLAGGGLISIAFGLFYLNSFIYSQDKAFSYFREYSKARSEIVDYADYGYSEKLSEIGISKNDYYMIKSWSFGDETVFNLQTMQKTAEIIKEQYRNRELSLSTLWNSIQMRELSNYPIFKCCITLFLLGILFSPKKWWSFLCSIGIGTGYFFYFAFRERLLYRIDFSILLGVFLCGLFFIQDSLLERNSFNKIEKTLCAVTILGCLFWCTSLFIPDTSYQTVTSDSRQQYINDTFFESWNFNPKKYKTNTNKEKPKSNLLSEIEENPQNFYFMDFNTTVQTLYFEYSPWKALPINYFNNHLHLGGVTANFPDIIQTLNKKGLDKPLASLVNANIYLIDNYYPERKLIFLQEHYYPQARIELYKEIDGYQIWKFYKE